MFLIFSARMQANFNKDFSSTRQALERSDPSFSWAALSLRLCPWFITRLCQCSLFAARLFLFFLKPDIWLNAGWCTNTVQMLPCYCVRTENSEIVRNGCNVVSAMEVLYSFCMASSVPRVAQVFCSTPKTSLFQLGKRKLWETGCVLPFLDEMSPSLL